MISILTSRDTPLVIVDVSHLLLLVMFLFPSQPPEPRLTSITTSEHYQTIRRLQSTGVFIRFIIHFVIDVKSVLYRFISYILYQVWRVLQTTEGLSWCTTSLALYYIVYSLKHVITTTVLVTHFNWPESKTVHVNVAYICLRTHALECLVIFVGSLLSR